MEISHTSLYTTDLERMKQFYETYFHASAGPKYRNPKTGLETYFLSFEGTAQLEIMTRPGLTEASLPEFPTGWDHLAFRTGSRETVNELTERLACDGYRTLSAPRITGDGHYESCVADPDGNLIEIVA